MKIRNGFVSNSSSSSFLIAVKDGHDLKEEMDKLVDKVKEIETPFNFGAMAHDLVNTFVSNAELLTKDEIDDGYIADDDEAILAKLKDGWKIYYGSVYDDGWDDPTELIAVSLELDYEGETIVMKKNSYY